MNLISRYLIKDLFISLVFITASLTFAVWLTQILRFLELVVDAGAPSGLFLQLLLLTIPKFLEIVLPIALLASVLFVYNKMIADNELIVMRAAGMSQWDLAKPVLYLSLTIALVLFLISGWLNPLSYAKLQQIRQLIKSQYTSTLISEGVFNSFGKGLTVYVDEKMSNGELKGILIHQTIDKENPLAKENKEIPSSTILAETGLLVSDGENTRIIVSKGSRQQRDDKTGYVSRLDFDRYTIDITPEKKVVHQRWPEPNERTLIALFHPDMNNPIDVQNLNKFRGEIHKRIAIPFFLVSFSLLGLVFLLVGAFNRRGYNKRILACLGIAIILQSLFLTGVSLAKESIAGIILLYFVSIFPIFIFLFILNKDSKVNQIIETKEIES